MRRLTWAFDVFLNKNMAFFFFFFFFFVETECGVTAKIKDNNELRACRKRVYNVDTGDN